MTAELQQFGTAKNGHLILAHGAGAGMDSTFMQYFAKELSKRGVAVTLFNFPYMALRTKDGKKRPPDRASKLLEHFRAVVHGAANSGKLVIGGKSMGGRMASMLLAETPELANGLIVLGYPFHPPGKPEKLRTDHFGAIQAPTLILQGERDTFGNRAFLKTLTLPETMTVTWVTDGDHSFKPRKASGLTEAENWETAVEKISTFIKGLG